MKHYLLTTVLTVIAFASFGWTTASGSDSITSAVQSSQQSINTQAEAPKIVATKVSLVDNNLELPKTEYKSNHWISALGVIIFTSTVAKLVVNKYRQSENS